MKYNLSSIMHSAWKIFRRVKTTFAEALRLAWHNAKAVAKAKAAAGISEETHTWSGWKAAGYDVIHESKALYRVVVADPATKSGTRTIAYFGIHQVQPIAE